MYAIDAGHLCKMILLGLPTYDSKIHNRLMLALLNEANQPNTPSFSVLTNHSSLLARGFNELYCYALNHRPEVTHFMMIHADVIPERGFIGKMYAEMERAGCDVLSVALPLKDNRGLTSTALDMGHKEPKRLSLKELALLPETFEALDLARLNGNEKVNIGPLLVNSGLMLVDLRKPWCEQCWFAITDRIERNEQGIFQPVTDSEDWYFSRRARLLGAKVMATRIIQARHVGNMEFPNWGAWGTHVQDDADLSVLKKREPQNV